MPVSPFRDRLSIIVLFARFWSANMDMVHAKGQSWPGFSYSDDEKAAMHQTAGGVPSVEFFFTTALVALLAIAISAGCVGLMFWRLDVRCGGNFSLISGSMFFYCLMLAAAAAISIGLPISIFAACRISAAVFRPDPQTLPDLDFSRRLTFKASRQIARMGVGVCVACLVYGFFVPVDSKFDLFLRRVVPTLGPAVAGLSALYYYAGRAIATRPQKATESETRAR